MDKWKWGWRPEEGDLRELKGDELWGSSVIEGGKDRLNPGVIFIDLELDEGKISSI